MGGEPLRIYVGWDAKVPESYDVCVYSLQRHTSSPLDIRPLQQASLREEGLYWRPSDPLASTEFTYSRFLVPALAGYSGWALYCDCDFLWRADVAELFQHCSDPDVAVYCVQHDHRPTENLKMDGKVQTSYPRKNWSSLMMFNCGHPSSRSLTPEVVNTQTGAYLHRLAWAQDQEIGGLKCSSGFAAARPAGNSGCCSPYYCLELPDFGQNDYIGVFAPVRLFFAAAFFLGFARGASPHRPSRS